MIEQTVSVSESLVNELEEEYKMASEVIIDEDS